MRNIRNVTKSNTFLSDIYIGVISQKENELKLNHTLINGTEKKIAKYSFRLILLE